MSKIEPPDSKAQPLLRTIVEQIKLGRIREGNPRTFLPYSEALELMGVPRHGRSGQQLQRHGLNELNHWTIQYDEVPKIAALIVNKRTHHPSSGFAKSHGHHTANAEWKTWWLREANRSINYDWAPFLTSFVRYRGQESKPAGDKVHEDGEGEAADYSDIIVLDPPPAHIRQSRVTVGDVLRWLAEGRSENDILRQHPELRSLDIRASLAYAADRERRIAKPSFTERWTGKFALPTPDPTDARLTYLLGRYEKNRK